MNIHECKCGKMRFDKGESSGMRAGHHLSYLRRSLTAINHRTFRGFCLLNILVTFKLVVCYVNFSFDS